ncbi:cation:proton antiporter [bacterium]|nr:cation:proton antiporter [bacterium]
MGEHIFLFGLLVFLAYSFTILFKKTRIPDVLLLMVLGILIGPKLLNITSADYFGRFGSILTTIALVVILFEGGTGLNLKILRSAWDETLLITIPTFVLTMAAAGFFGYYILGLNVMQSAIVGSILGGTSSAVVVPVMKNLKIGNLPFTVLFMESAITDVLAIVVTFSLINALTIGHLKTGLILGNILSTLIVSTIFGVGGGAIWSVLLSKIREFPNNLFSTVAFIFIVYGITEFFGFNGAISALAFGITLSNMHKMPEETPGVLNKFTFARLKSSEKLFFQELVFLLKIFFFVYLGLSINFSQLRNMMYGLLVTVVIFLFRMLVVKFFLPKKINIRDASTIAVMVPKGLAAAVLATLPFELGLINDTAAQNFVYSVILFSIVLNALLITSLELPSPIRKFYYLFFSNFHKVPQETEISKKK